MFFFLFLLFSRSQQGNEENVLSRKGFVKYKFFLVFHGSVMTEENRIMDRERFVKKVFVQKEEKKREEKIQKVSGLCLINQFSVLRPEKYNYKEKEKD